MNTTKKFESVWMDNAGTMMLIQTGTLSADQKTLTMTGSMADPVSGKPGKVREVQTSIDENTSRLEMFSTGPDGKEIKTLQIDYTRAK